MQYRDQFDRAGAGFHLVLIDDRGEMPPDCRRICGQMALKFGVADPALVQQFADHLPVGFAAELEGRRARRTSHKLRAAPSGMASRPAPRVKTSVPSMSNRISRIYQPSVPGAPLNGPTIFAVIQPP